MNFAVIGGDMRYVMLSKLLWQDGHNVTSFAQEKIEPYEGIRIASSMRDAVENSEYLILPLPAVTKNGMINAPLSCQNHTINDLLSKVGNGQILFAGKPEPELLQSAETNRITVCDYYSREEFSIMNAALTAEGAIGVIMDETRYSILGANVLIVGYGRIGKLLSTRLKALGADVTVSARKMSDIAWIKSYGMKSCMTSDIGSYLSWADIVVNTVPAKIIDRTMLSLINRDALIVDLASYPGGIDFDAASELGIKTVCALGLPGECAPESAAGCIRNTIYNIISEGGTE